MGRYFSAYAGQAGHPRRVRLMPDVALYQAKREGRDRVAYFTDDMNELVRHRYKMEADLRTALVEELLSVHYQPQVDMATGRILGAEALLRWNRARP